MANQVTYTFSGDATALDRAFDKAGASAKDMAGDMDKASGDVKAFGSSMDGINDTVDTSEGKFMGTADLLDGLGGAFGLPVDGAVNMARSMGDLAGGMTSVVLPAIKGVLVRLGLMTAATTAETAATEGAAAAQGGLNAALLANPIGLVVVAIAALVGGFILAWKHSETFRDVVRGAIDVVQRAAERFVDFFRAIPAVISGVGSAIVDAIVWPFKTAFNLVARLWNATVGKLSFEVPSWIPGMGGKGFSMPNLPTFDQGGVMPGPRGVHGLAWVAGGETILPTHRGGAGPQVIQLVLDGRVLAEVTATGQRINQGRGFAA